MAVRAPISVTQLARAGQTDGLAELELAEVSDDINRLLGDCDDLDLSPCFRSLLFALDEALTAAWPAAERASG